MVKLSKFAEKVKKVKRKDVVTFKTDDGEGIEFLVESRGENEIDAINAKYDKLKPKVPTKRLPVHGGKYKTIENDKDPEYRTELLRVQKMNFAELALLFLAKEERPEGELQEQIEEIRGVELAGFIPKIVQRGLELSGIVEEEEESYEEALEAEKND